MRKTVIKEMYTAILLGKSLAEVFKEMYLKQLYFFVFLRNKVIPATF
jgi:hypothetical protein